ncbi:MAG: DUF1554 domain-containing protein [bacterium]|nr:DUF1554 domain-containing protein [bacterium]
MTIITQPISQTCIVTNSTGTISTTDISNITVACLDDVVPTYSLSGTVSGLDGAMTLTISGEDLDLDSNGTFAFTSEFIEGEDFTVTVSSEEDHQICTLNVTSDTFEGENYDTLSISCRTLIVFRSNSSSDGNLDGISGADALCMADANKPDDGHTYNAFLVDGVDRRACSSGNCVTNGIDENIDWVLKPNKEYRRSDGGAPIGTTNASGIFGFPVGNSLTSSSSAIWTGFVSLGNWTTNVASNCERWTNNASGDGGIGSTGATNSSLINSGNLACDGGQGNMWLMCVRQ